MFKNIFIGCAGLILITLSFVAKAHIIVYMPSTLNGLDTCSQLTNTWTGYGKITAAGILTCRYKGTLNMSEVGGSKYAMQVSLDKQSGVCPAHEDLSLTATCNNGVIIVNTDQADLRGNLTSDGRAADFLGKLYFMIFGKKVTANVDEMHISKR